MAKGRRGAVPESLAQELTQFKAEERSRTAGMENMVIVPGPAGAIPLDNFHLDYYKPQLNKSIFSNPEDHLVDPQPGHIYVWMERTAKKDQGLRRALRSGRYKSVHPSRLKSNSELAACSFSVTPDEQCLCVGDLALVEGSPKAVDQDYRSRELMAAMRVKHGAGVDTFRSVAASRGVNVDDVPLKEIEVEE